MKYRARRIASIFMGFRLKLQHRNIKCNWKETLIEKGVVIVCRDDGLITANRIIVEPNVYLASSGSLMIGNNVFFNRNTIVVCREQVTIGDNCIIGPNVCVYDHDHIFDASGIKEGFKTRPVRIGNNCWIGAGVIILKGSIIGNNCVIGAGTVVTGMIPDGSIVKSNRDYTTVPIK